MGLLDKEQNNGLLGLQNLGQFLTAWGDPGMMNQVTQMQIAQKRQMEEDAMRRLLFQQQQEEKKKADARNKKIADYMGVMGTEQAGPVMPGQGMLLGGGRGALADGFQQKDLEGLIPMLMQDPETMSHGISLHEALNKQYAPTNDFKLMQEWMALPDGHPGKEFLRSRMDKNIHNNTGGGKDGFRVNTQTYVNENGGRIIARDAGDGFIKYYDEKSGKELRALPSGYSPENQMYIDQRADANRNLSQLRLAASVEQDISAAASKDLEPIKKVARTLDQLEVSLLSNSPVSKADIQKGLANITAGGQRAMAELDLSANFGDLLDRIGNSISAFVTGELPDTAKAEILEYIRQIRSGFVDASKAEIIQRYRAKADRSQDFGVNSERVFGSTGGLPSPETGVKFLGFE